MGSTAYALFLYFGLPVGLSLLLLRAGWLEIANAYCLWVPTLLFGAVLLGARTGGELIGWALIFGMFLTTPAIPILIKVCRSTGFSLPWFA